MKTSIIIATLNRPQDLANTLQSISQSTLLPHEVIIVEQGEIERTQQIAEQYAQHLNIQVLYFDKKSGALARNFGVKQSEGDVIYFFDDDVTIDANYISHAHNFLVHNPTVYGLNGRDLLGADDKTSMGSLFKRLFGVLFFVSSFRRYNKVLPSGQNTLRNNTDQKQCIEWLSGCNMVIRRRVFTEGLEFNPHFTRWSFGEDVMLSYQVYKKYGTESLMYLPSLKIEHHQSKEARLLGSQKIKMQIIYRYIFWKQEVKKNNMDTIAFLWSQVGFVVLHLAKSKSISELGIIWSAYMYLIKNKKKIVDNSIKYNSFILN